MKYASLQEIREWENTIEEQESAKQLEFQKATRILGVYIAENLTEKNVVVMALKFDELKKTELAMDKQISSGKEEKIRDEKYRILGYYQGDIKTIKEKIKEFFQGSKTPNIFRVNKPILNNKEIIQEIEELIKSENDKINFPPAKIEFVKCNFEGEANDQKKYTDAISEACSGLEKTREENKLEFDKSSEAQDLKKEIIHQLGTISYPKQPDGRIKVEIAEDLTYEFLDALIFIVKPGGMPFDFTIS